MTASYQKKNPLLGGELRVVNVGLELFADELRKQGVEVVHVAFQPPRKLEGDLEDLLSKML